MDTLVDVIKVNTIKNITQKIPVKNIDETVSYIICGDLESDIDEIKYKKEKPPKGVFKETKENAKLLLSEPQYKELCETGSFKENDMVFMTIERLDIAVIHSLIGILFIGIALML